MGGTLDKLGTWTIQSMKTLLGEEVIDILKQHLNSNAEAQFF